MDGAFLRAHGVSKRFSGHVAAERLSFEVRRGEVFALLGPNGAGKTTTVRMLVGIIRPDEGRIEVLAEGAARDRLRPDRTGYLPEDRGLYQEIPILRSLVYFGRLRGLDGREAGRRACGWLERMSLLDRKNDRLDALSKGNQQRVQFIAAVLHRPALAILDEPFSGLDPLSQEFFLDLVRDLRNAGTTILLSSHQMDLVERVADRVLLLNHGREVLSGSIGELHGRLDGRPRLRVTLERAADAGVLRADDDVEDVAGDGPDLRVTLRAGARTPQFLARLVTRVPLTAIGTDAPRLHDVFIRAVRDDEARIAGRTS
jgi:ABC-2 type transport system ATP-binding protein